MEASGTPCQTPCMSSQTVVETTPNQPSRQSVFSAEARLAELKRALQRLVRRKLKAYELAARDHAALLALRSEIAARDGKSSSEDIVRLANCARRALGDFERIARVGETKAKPRTMADIEAELRRHG